MQKARRDLNASDAVSLLLSNRGMERGGREGVLTSLPSGRAELSIMGRNTTFPMQVTGEKAFCIFTPCRYAFSSGKPEPAG